MGHPLRTFLHVLLVALISGLPSTAFGDAIVAKVGSSAVPQRRLIARITSQLPMLSFHGKVTKEMFDKLRKDLTQQLIEEELLFLEAKRLRLIPPDAQVKAFRDRQVASRGGPAKFSRLLVKYHTTWKEHWEEARRQLAIQKVLARFVEPATRVTDEDVKKVYTAEPARFRRPPEVKLRELLYKVQPTDPDKRWKEARERARQAVAKARAGTDFERIPAQAKARDLGWVHKGRLSPEIDEAAFKLKPGEVSDPIRTLHGFSVIKVEGLRAARQIPLTEMAPKLKVILAEKRRDEARAALLKRLRAQHKVIVLMK